MDIKGLVFWGWVVCAVSDEVVGQGDGGIWVDRQTTQQVLMSSVRAVYGGV